MTQFLVIPDLSPKELEKSSYSLAYEITQSIKTTPISWTSCLMRWSTPCLWSVSPWINLLSLSFGLPFNPFLYEAKNPHVAIPGTHLRPRTRPSSSAPLLCYNRTLQIYEKPLDCTLESMKMKVLVAQSCPTLWNPTDCSLPGSSVHGILQARILEWVAIPFSRGSFWPGIEPRFQTGS